MTVLQNTNHTVNISSTTQLCCNTEKNTSQSHTSNMRYLRNSSPAWLTTRCSYPRERLKPTISKLWTTSSFQSSTSYRQDISTSIDHTGTNNRWWKPTGFDNDSHKPWWPQTMTTTTITMTVFWRQYDCELCVNLVMSYKYAVGFSRFHSWYTLWLSWFVAVMV